MADQKSLFRRLLDGADLAEESLPLQPVVELLGDNRVLIENHRGVTQYCTERIQARVSFGAVNIQGGNLRLRYMTGQKLVIVGKIDSIEVVRGRSK